MRLGLSGKLFLAIFSTCILVLLIMHWGVRISFEHGFIDYVKLGNQQRVMLIAAELEERYNQQGNWRFIHHNNRLISQIMHGIDQNNNNPNNLLPYGWRTPLWVVDHQDNKLVGPPGKIPREGIRQEIRFQGKNVGWVITTPAERLTRQADINFDQKQRQTSWLIVALATLLAAAVTGLLSRNMLAPVKQLVNTMHQLAAGNFTTRVTARSRDELGKLAQDVNHLAITLERNEQIRKELMADISHELRTPLAVLHGELEALQDGVRQVTSDSLLSLLTEVKTLTKLVDDLHQLSLSDVGALAYRKTRTNMVSQIKQAISAFSERFKQKGITLSVTLPEQAWGFGDPDRLLQLFNNLLENSLRYTDTKGDVEIYGTLSSNALLISWQDSAPGVSDEQLLRIFERFYRAEGSRNRANGGTGLGLAICQNIIEAHDGKIYAQHSPLGGVAFQLALPLENTT